jgi:ketosteroid isomerase-like protein
MRAGAQHRAMQADTDNERLVLEFFSVLSAGNFARLSEMLHDEATWTPMIRGIPGAGVHRGKSGIIDEFLVPVRGMFRPGDPKTTVDTICSKGSLVLTESRGSGQVADGRPYENQYAWAFEIRDGKILAVREYMDSLYVATLFGMAKDA